MRCKRNLISDLSVPSPQFFAPGVEQRVRALQIAMAFRIKIHQHRIESDGGLQTRRSICVKVATNPGVHSFIRWLDPPALAFLVPGAHLRTSNVVSLTILALRSTKPARRKNISKPRSRTAAKQECAEHRRDKIRRWTQNSKSAKSLHDGFAILGPPFRAPPWIGAAS